MKGGGEKYSQTFATFRRTTEVKSNNNTCKVSIYKESIQLYMNALDKQTAPTPPATATEPTTIPNSIIKLNHSFLTRFPAAGPNSSSYVTITVSATDTTKTKEESSHSFFTFFQSQLVSMFL